MAWSMTHSGLSSSIGNSNQRSTSLSIMNRVLFLSLLMLVAVTDAFLPWVCPKTSTRSTVVPYLKAEMSQEEKDVAMERALKSMTAFTNKYLGNTCTTLCSDKSVPAVVIKGLAEHKVTLGAPLCPCRFYDDKEKEAKDGYWNCPCVPMRERHECHCMLFLTEDNDFAGKETEITYEEVSKLSSGVEM